MITRGIRWRAPILTLVSIIAMMILMVEPEQAKNYKFHHCKKNVEQAQHVYLAHITHCVPLSSCLRKPIPSLLKDRYPSI